MSTHTALIRCGSKRGSESGVKLLLFVIKHTSWMKKPVRLAETEKNLGNYTYLLLVSYWWVVFAGFFMELGTLVCADWIILFRFDDDKLSLRLDYFSIVEFSCSNNILDISTEAKLELVQLSLWSGIYGFVRSWSEMTFMKPFHSMSELLDYYIKGWILVKILWQYRLCSWCGWYSAWLSRCWSWSRKRWL